MSSYIIDCYVVKVIEQPEYEPDQITIEVWNGETQVAALPVAGDVPGYQVVVLILNLISTLPPCTP